MRQWKGFLAGVAATLLAVGLVVTAGAKTGKVMQELTYRDIRVSLDGEILDLRNAIGEPVEPFMFDGTNYLPVRALAEALGLNVAWDGANVMVVLTTPTPETAEPEASEAEPDRTGTGNTVATPAPEDVSRTVYVTPTGKHWHYDSSCNGGTYYASTYAEAVARGLTPCEKCVLSLGLA